ncbi:MAG: hypothetical protein HY741_29640 [Chloroflexi bacterium]|nr:hypothetical protein [Chloroflexota bacterium]
MDIRGRLELYRKHIDRPEFQVLLFPLVLLILSQILGAMFHTETFAGSAFVVCIFWGPLFVMHVWGAGKAWDDFKRRDYPKELALFALVMNALAPFAVIFAILYV